MHQKMLSSLSDNFHVVRREDAFPVAYPASPPIRLVLGPLDDGDDVALFEAEVPWIQLLAFPYLSYDLD
jgi:hypothetical protein